MALQRVVGGGREEGPGGTQLAVVRVIALRGLRVGTQQTQVAEDVTAAGTHHARQTTGLAGRLTARLRTRLI